MNFIWLDETVSGKGSCQMVVSEMPRQLKVTKIRCLDSNFEIPLPKSPRLQVLLLKGSRGSFTQYGRATVMSYCCLMILPWLCVPTSPPSPPLVFHGVRSQVNLLI